MSTAQPESRGVMNASISQSIRRKALLIGYPIAHSLSPLLHNSIFKNIGLDWYYEKLDTDNIEKAIEAIKSPEVIGCSITMPLKVSVMDFLDKITPQCKIIGSCNTIVMKPGIGKSSDSKQLIGDNTDCIGIREAINRAMLVNGHAISQVQRPALVIGGGGTTRSAVYALHTWLNASPIYLLNRLASETEDVISHFNGFGIEVRALDPFDDSQQIPEFFFIIGCIPDIQPNTEAEKMVRSRTYSIIAQSSSKGIILDMCYKPRWTSLLQQGAKHDWITVDGIEVLIDQGIQQNIQWTGSSREVMKADEIANIIRKADEVLPAP